MKDTKKSLILILLLALFIRLLASGQTIFGDEFGFLENVRLTGSYGLNEITASSLLVPWIHWIEAALFGLTPVVLKLGAIFFGLVTILITYLLTKRLFGEKPALWASLLLAISSYHIFTTTLIGSDEPHLFLLFTLAIYSFVRSIQDKDNRWFWFTGIFFGLSLLTKQTGVFILPIIFFYDWLQSKKFLNSVKRSVYLLIIGLAIYSIFPILSFLANSDIWWQGVTHTVGKVSGNTFSFAIAAIQYLLSFIWMGPLLFGFIYLSFAKWKKHSLPSIWVWVMLFAYIVINTEITKPLDRYFGILVIPLSIIGGKWIADLNLKKLELKVAGLWVILGSIVFFLLNNTKGQILDFYPKEAYISLNLNFLVPISGGSGPIGFYLHSLFLVLAFIITLSAFIFAMVKWKHARFFVLAFLGLSIAYNVVLTTNYLDSDIDKANKEIIEFANTNSLKEPIYVFRNPAYNYYLSANYGNPYSDINIIDFYMFDTFDFNQLKDSSVILIDFPKVSRDSKLWQTMNNCELKKQVSNIGFIYEC